LALAFSEKISGKAYGIQIANIFLEAIWLIVILHCGLLTSIHFGNRKEVLIMIRKSIDQSRLSFMDLLILLTILLVILVSFEAL
jgi:hypothetical protein